MFPPDLFFDLERYEDSALFHGVEQVWEVVPGIAPYLERTISPNISTIRSRGEVLQKPYALWQGKVYSENIIFSFGDPARGTFKVFFEDRELPGATALYPGAALLSDDIELGPGAVVEPGALILGPTRIGSQTVVRQGAYLRGGCLVGKRCVVGHVTEMKNSVMLDDAKAGHFAYVGDSILGSNSNLGAGTKLANLKMLSTPMRFIDPGGAVFTVPFRKLGAILGDDSQTGCNSVTNPGVLLGKRCIVSPNATVKPGFYRSRTIIRQAS